jgi:hypothetical protein
MPEKAAERAERISQGGYGTRSVRNPDCAVVCAGSAAGSALLASRAAVVFEEAGMQEQLQEEVGGRQGVEGVSEEHQP